MPRFTRVKSAKNPSSGPAKVSVVSHAIFGFITPVSMRDQPNTRLKSTNSSMDLPPL